MSPRIVPDYLWPSQPLVWIGLFAGLFCVAFLLNAGLLALFAGPLELIPDRVALIFLPAFIRLAAVLVSGVAGLIGIFLGSFAISFFYSGESFVYAIIISLSSALGVFAAYWLMLRALDTHKIAFTLINLIVLAILYSALNALAHGLVWGLIEQGPSARVTDLAAMMIGDLVGVVFGFYITRLILRIYARLRPRVKPSALS